MDNLAKMNTTNKKVDRERIVALMEQLRPLSDSNDYPIHIIEFAMKIARITGAEPGLSRFLMDINCYIKTYICDIACGKGKITDNNKDVSFESKEEDFELEAFYFADNLESQGDSNENAECFRRNVEYYKYKGLTSCIKMPIPSKLLKKEPEKYKLCPLSFAKEEDLCFSKTAKRIQEYIKDYILPIPNDTDRLSRASEAKDAN